MNTVDIVEHVWLGSAASTTCTVYDPVFNPSTEIGKKSIKSGSKDYTTNKNFLKESQKLYSQANSIPFNKIQIEKMIHSWKNIRNQNKEPLILRDLINSF